MSLLIDIDRISAVLLPDGWHSVAPLPDGRSSFVVDSYELFEGGGGGYPVLRGGQVSGIVSTGFEFTETGTLKVYVGPLTSVMALRIGEGPPMSDEDEIP